MSLDPCPFCGKQFKRLKTHLPHCKMSPGSKTTRSNTAPKELETQKPQKNKTSTFRDNLKESSSLKTQVKSKVKAEKASLDKGTLAKVPSADRRNIDTVKPKNKLAKSEQERVKRSTLLTQKGSKSSSDSQKEKNNCLISETSKVQVKETLHIERKSAQIQNLKKSTGFSSTSIVTSTRSNTNVPDLLQVPWTTGFQAEQGWPTHKPNANIFEGTQNSPKDLSNGLTLVPTVKSDLSSFQTKTCVWTHIKHGLYDRRLDSVPALNLSEPTEVFNSKSGNISIFLHKHATENNQTASHTTSATLLALGPTSSQRPAEDLFTSTLQSKRVMEWSSEMAKDSGRPSHSGVFSDEGLLTKPHFSRHPPENPNPVTVQRLQDVRLCRLAAWLCNRTPKSPREAVTIFHRGWQWYYRKYFDVQKGGIGGISMLIAGYCVLSYIWCYPHLKKERWRKYH